MENEVFSFIASYGEALPSTRQSSMNLHQSQKHFLSMENSFVLFKFSSLYSRAFIAFSSAESFALFLPLNTTSRTATMQIHTEDKLIQCKEC
ncbi:hypothetical protein DMENIID0001_106200 [Sergentomyia squamirostris]